YAVKFGVAGDDNIAQLNLFSNSSAGSGSYEKLWLHSLHNLRDHFPDRVCRPIVVKMQARFHQQDAGLSDADWKIQAQAVVVACHIRRLVVEGSHVPGDQRNVTLHIVAILVPLGYLEAGCEQRCECGRFGGRPSHDDGIVTLKLGQVSALRRRLGQRRGSGLGGSRPWNHAREPLTLAQQSTFDAGRFKALLRRLGIVIEPEIFDIDGLQWGECALCHKVYPPLVLRRIRVRSCCRTKKTKGKYPASLASQTLPAQKFR